MSTSTKTFLDTNVLVYSVDWAHLGKHKVAQRCVEQIRQSGVGTVSTQVLKEFYSVATNKLHIPRPEARDMVSELKLFEVVPTTIELVDEAILLTTQHSISIWDAMLVAAAKSVDCRQILTEDLQHGQTIAGVKIVNPFV